MKIEFIEITKTDFPEILGMMADFNAIDNYPFDRETAQKNLSHFVSDNNLGIARTIRVNGTTAGYMILTYGFSFEHNGRDAFIDELFLKPDFRNKGIGKKAMKFIENEASRCGVNVIHLEVEQHNKSASVLYRNIGYKDNGRTLLSKKIK